jgi:pimeloyl-ACP methyl ester carboxylesterase
LPALAQSLGFAFATTSYRANGLVVLEGMQDIQELLAAARRTIPNSIRRTYLIGASEGGLISTLLAERSPRLFTGVYSLCGPIGDFGLQIGYIGDFRVLFDYFFPGVIPGDPIVVPRDVIDNWATTYEPAVRRAVLANPSAASQLIRTSGAPVDPTDPASVATTAAHVLWYAVFSTNDAAAKLGGNPYDNRLRWYSGSDNDWLLNSTVRRAAASPTALARLAQYQTSGQVDVPLVTMHTIRDEVIPYWHQVLYWWKTHLNGKSPLQIPVDRYGHCNFRSDELLIGFGLLVLGATNERVPGVPELPSREDVRRSFERSQHEGPSRIPRSDP